MKFRVEIACTPKFPGDSAKAVMHVNAACMLHAIVRAMNAAVGYGFHPRYATKAELKAGLLEDTNEG